MTTQFKLKDLTTTKTTPYNKKKLITLTEQIKQNCGIQKLILIDESGEVIR